MYTYYVIFDSNGCEFERDLVFADNKKQAIIDQRMDTFR